MDIINFSDNIIRLRREKGITQETLADFVGVTKASVSKWETKQSFPDIILLPQLACYFDVTVDELLGYEPQLSKEQIQKYYFDFAARFAKQPFDEVMAQCDIMVKKYYSCYPFLLQICILWLNHCSLTEEKSRQLEILDKITTLCTHIMENSKDPDLCKDALIVKSMIDLQEGRVQEVIDTLEDMCSPYRLSSKTDLLLLIQAYQMAGRQEKATQYTQFNMYSDLISLVTTAASYIQINGENQKICEETIARIDQVIDIYALDKLHPNSTAQFNYSAVLLYCSIQKKELAMERLKRFVEQSCSILDGENSFLHGDHYFNHIDKIFENSDLGSGLIRDKKIILRDLKAALNSPALEILRPFPEFQKLNKQLDSKGETL